MPLVTWDTKQDFDSQYEIGAEGAWGVPSGRSEIVLHYNRFVMLEVSRQRARKVVEALGWNPTTLGIIVGCGFGWLIDALEELGVGIGGGRLIGTDISPYIQSAKSLNEDDDCRNAVNATGLSTSTGDGLTLFGLIRNSGLPRSKRAADILNEDGKTSTSRGRIRQALKQGASNYDVLSEDVLSSLTNAEATQLSQAAHSFSGVARVAHLVGEYEPPYNQNKLADWQALLPNDIFILP